jgi:hypothetical protein
VRLPIKIGGFSGKIMGADLALNQISRTTFGSGKPGWLLTLRPAGARISFHPDKGR